MAIGPAALVCFQAGVNNAGARLVCPGFDEGRLWASSYLAGWNLSADFFFFFFFTSASESFPRGLQQENQSCCAEIPVLHFDGLVFFKLQCFKMFSLDSCLALPVRAKKI